MKKILIMLALFIAIPAISLAQSADELRNQIQDHNEYIKKLEQEISKYEAELETVAKKKKTLNSAVSALDISRRKVGAKISATKSRIYTTSKEIEDLDYKIGTKRDEISLNKTTLAKTIRKLNIEDEQTEVEILLNGDSFASIWENSDFLASFQSAIKDRISNLASAKIAFESIKTEYNNKKVKLEKQKKELNSQKYSLDINRREKDKLLKQTKERESNYQKLLSEKRKAKKEFEAIMRSLESQLKYTLDPSKLPPAKEGTLLWPLDKIKITQYFGNTKFAKSGAYNGRGHNGIDLRAQIGTPVKATLAGKIEAIGNTDKYKGCYSYGKWVLIRHLNGLSSLYAHLSEISTSPGNKVTTGQIIGYSGSTGYSTGPHLHLSLFASSEVRIVKLGEVKKKTHCANARVPIAPFKAYLNPLEYLPK